MDSDTSTARPSTYVGGGEATVSSFITFIILLAGVLGGLLIVVCVIIVCKYCLKSKKNQRGSFRSGRYDSGRAVRLLQRYETINSDVFSEPSSVSIDGIPLSPRKPLDLRNSGRRDESEEVDERTHLCSLLDKEHTYDPAEGEASVSSSAHPTSRLTGGSGNAKAEGDGASISDRGAGGGGGGGGGGSVEAGSKERMGGLPSTTTTTTTTSGYAPGQEPGQGGGQASRRVSFQLDAVPHLAARATTAARRCPLQSSCRRYTEGDFHHLKHSKIAYGLPRQLSLGACAPGSRSAPPLSATAEGAFSYSLDERLRMLLDQVDSDDPEGPPVQRRSPDRPTFQPAVRPGHGGRKFDPYHPLQAEAPLFSQRPGVATGLQPPASPARLLQQQGMLGRRRSPSTSPSPPLQPGCTKVDVEVHRQPGASPEGLKAFQDGGPYELMGPLGPPGPPLHVQRSHAYQKKASSHSLELAGSRRRLAHPTRKVKSYEDFADYDVLQITEFSRGPFYNSDFDVISELASPTLSMVRYNDTGSLEQLNEETPGDSSGLALEAFLPPEESDDTDTTLNGTYQYRELWHLRATLEEEEECSDTIRMEDMTSPEDSPDREHAHTPHTTSFESTVPSDAGGSDQRDSGIQWEKRVAQFYQKSASRYGAVPPPAVGPAAAAEVGGGGEIPVRHPYAQYSLCVNCGRKKCGCRGNGGGAAQLLPPKYENRRQSYKNLLTGRLPKAPAAVAAAAAAATMSASGSGNVPVSAENSFDSVETDGDLSDTSRHEMTTTSFESTTDNTDSTTESQHSRLRHMKTDSGYKSLETQQSGSREVVEAADPPATIEERIKEVPALEGNRQRAAAAAVLEERRNGSRGSRSGSNGGNGNGTGSRPDVAGGRRNSNAVLFERRAGRTASKKRREYSRERQVIHVYDSINEPETDSRSDLHSGDSFEDGRHPHYHSNNGHHHTQQHQQQQQHYHASGGGGTAPSSKRSVFTRFFSQGRESREKYAFRDYSIDEKTNQIFNEFLRQEAPLEGNGRLSLRRSPRNQTRPRLQRKHTEPVYDDRRRDRLAPEMRSASLGSDSSASSVRKLSPQDSIEEEYEEEEEPEGGWRRTELAPMLEVGGDSDAAGEVKRSVLSAKALHDIPIIKLPEEETQEAS